MTLYEAIFARRSVRQYDATPVNGAELAEIQQYVSTVKQLPGQSARFAFVTADKLKGGMAPNAILALSGDSDQQLVNIGYTLQGVDLWLQANRYGSVWCGMAKPTDPAPDYRILLGFGKTAVPLRTRESVLKRKTVTEISNADNAVARAVRAAPSAVNFQP
ncbi:MAG: nitroreductase, partial [Clostridiales bacterium]|nr:nitroreductase [Clostridiales bacterium]